MTDANSSAVEHKPESPSQVPLQRASAKIHRVCIGCNNMFEVTIENYELKHCPVCRKE
jgi:rRNA maturation endonuclease Nob1